MGDAQFLDQPGYTVIQHRVAPATGLLCERTGDPGLTGTDGAGDEQALGSGLCGSICRWREW
jgi:hypothetical protein